MSTRFTRALLRRPGQSFAAGLTTSGEGAPDQGRALAQHAAYAEALASLGLSLTVLEADEGFPDGVFVEDTAVVAAGAAMITRPGAPSRAGETAVIAQALSGVFPNPARIATPGTLDGGDVCETDDIVLIGLSERTNVEGARQLAAHLAALGRPSEVVDALGVEGLLHLKSGISYLGDGRLAVDPRVAHLPAFARFERVRVDLQEAYAANCVRVNDRVLVAKGYPRFAERLDRLGYRPLLLDVSEFRKMDGGLSCLSIRYAGVG